MVGRDNLETKTFVNSYKTNYENHAIQVNVIFENIEHLRLDGVSVFVCVCVCVLVGGCIVSLAGLRVCVLVSSGGAKIRYFFVSPCGTHEAET